MRNFLLPNSAKLCRTLREETPRFKMNLPILDKAKKGSLGVNTLAYPEQP